MSPSLLITLLFLLVISQGLIIFWFFINQRSQQQWFTQVWRKYKALKSELRKRSKKLKTSNNQLYKEIAQHEVTEELLHRTRAYLQDIINSMPSILIGVNKDSVITHWNTAANEASGIDYKQVLRKNLFDLELTLPIEKKMLSRAMNTRKIQQREKRVSSASGEPKHYSITIYPLRFSQNEGAVIRIDDISARVSMEQMMMHNDKLSSLGEMAAGIAHEINNPMSVVLQSVQNIQRRLSPELKQNRSTAIELGVSLEDLNTYLESRQILNFVEEIKQAGERTTHIVKNMLAFSRTQTHVTEDVDLKEIIDLAVTMVKQGIPLKSSSKHPIEISCRYPEQAPRMRCSPTQIQQVLLNLLNNALQAFDSESINPQVRITLSFSDRWAEIDVLDNGKGMDDWSLKHLFDPFFTTKETGQGTGLGLSICHYIITERHQGMIDVRSAPGKGSRFIISLPRA